MSFKTSGIILFVAAVSLICGGCSLMRAPSSPETINISSSQPENAANSPSVDALERTAKTQNEIRKVDFKNFTYEPYCAGEDTQKLTVKKGEYSLDKGDDKLFFNIGGISYGDLNGDGEDEAIVLSYCNTGGSGDFSEGFIYTMSDGKPKLVTRLPGGDRADGGLVSSRVENGLLLVVANDAGETGGACCPEFTVTIKYKLENKDLKKIGAESKKPLYPEERIKFARGSTQSVIKVKIDGIKRFVIGAQAGQILTASVDSKNVTLDLTRGEADVSNENSTLTAALKENGDYVIQLQNTNSKPSEVTLTVEIQ